MPKESMLRLSHPLKTKLLLCLPLAACLVLLWRTYGSSGYTPSWLDLPILVGGAAAVLTALYAVRSGCVIDGEGVTRLSLWGTRRLSRQDFLSYEQIAQEPGKTPDLLLRFTNGVVFLGAGKVDSSPEQVIGFLHENWGVAAADYQPPELGAVDPVQSFEYESLHVTVLLTVGVASLLVVLRLPVFALLAVVAAACFRAAWRAAAKLDTDRSGLTLTHRFGKPVKIAWDQVASVQYWSSFAQGGVRIRSTEGKTIRVYRWIGGYPLFDRLLHDRLAAKLFEPALALPMRVELNRRRRMGVLLPYFLVMANAMVPLLARDYYTFAAVAALPTLVAAFLLFASSRFIEIDQDGIRDTWRYLWYRKVNRFDRAELIEARLGRQLTVGGLWMKFGQTRLEIANCDASLAPEQILTSLRRHWSLGQNYGQQRRAA